MPVKSAVGYKIPPKWNKEQIDNFMKIIKNYPMDSFYGVDGKIILIEEDRVERISRGKKSFNRTNMEIVEEHLGKSKQWHIDDEMK